MQYKSKSCKPIKTPEDRKHWGGSYTNWGNLLCSVIIIFSPSQMKRMSRYRDPVTNVVVYSL